MKKEPEFRQIEEHMLADLLSNVRFHNSNSLASQICKKVNGAKYYSPTFRFELCRKISQAKEMDLLKYLVTNFPGCIPVPVPAPAISKAKPRKQVV